MTVHDVLGRTGPRKLLALDGGGIRGLIAIEVLASIEAQLQHDLGRGEDFVLADYFDYLAGTSTGAIIATCLSLGMRVDQVRRFYLDSGEEMFDKASLLRRFRTKFEDEKLARRLQREIGEATTLGGEELRTLLLIVMRNATTDSPWPVSNNPRAKYNRGLASNLQLPLWQLVRASTAAPTFFPPETVDVGGGRQFIFQDGGVTMYNNPAFLLFLMATVEPYELRWPAGREAMLLVSIGTGASPRADEDLDERDLHLIYHATTLPSALMFAASNEQDTLCRVFGECRHGDALDRELGDLRDAGGPADPKLFTYVRYNAELSQDWLGRHGLERIRPRDVQALDSTRHMDQLRAIGERVGEQVRSEHFAGFA